VRDKEVERFNRSVLEEGAHACPYTSEVQRIAGLGGFLHRHHHLGGHTALQ
jgi:hypothetical protein